MRTTYSNKKEHAVMASEEEALTIYLALESEIIRRQRLELPNDTAHIAHLERIVSEYKTIANGRPCVVCGTRTTDRLEVPVEGDGESGPYTVQAVVCDGCRDAYRAGEGPEPDGPATDVYVYGHLLAHFDGERVASWEFTPVAGSPDEYLRHTVVAEVESGDEDLDLSDQGPFWSAVRTYLQATPEGVMVVEWTE